MQKFESIQLLWMFVKGFSYQMSGEEEVVADKCQRIHYFNPICEISWLNVFKPDWKIC